MVSSGIQTHIDSCQEGWGPIHTTPLLCSPWSHLSVIGLSGHLEFLLRAANNPSLSPPPTDERCEVTSLYVCVCAEEEVLHLIRSLFHLYRRTGIHRVCHRRLSTVLSSPLVRGYSRSLPIHPLIPEDELQTQLPAQPHSASSLALENFFSPLTSSCSG